MAKASDVCLQLEIDKVPIMKEALAMYERGMSTGVNRSIRQLVATSIRYDRDLPVWHREIIMDPQTSGGLLVAVDPSQATKLVEALQRAGVSGACVVGQVNSLKDTVYLTIS